MSPGFTMIDNDAVIARLPEIGGTVVMVYLVLAWHANQEGVAWPSQEDDCEGDRPPAPNRAQGSAPTTCVWSRRGRTPQRARDGIPDYPGTYVPP